MCIVILINRFIILNLNVQWDHWHRCYQPNFELLAIIYIQYVYIVGKYIMYLYKHKKRVETKARFLYIVYIVFTLQCHNDQTNRQILPNM